jgi:hypothetical protein
MALWSRSSTRSSSWGESERTISTRNFVGAIAIALVAGLLLGYTVRGSNNGSNPTSKLKATNFQASQVIDPSVQAVSATPETSDGAVRSITSFITALPIIAAGDIQTEATDLNQIVDPNADPSVRSSLENDIDSARQNIESSQSAGQVAPTTMATASPIKLVFSPETYRVDMLAKDRARVQVWMVLVSADNSDQSTAANWSTTDVTLTWTDHWRISSFVANPGPTPNVQAPNGTFSSFAEVAQVFNGFYSYRYALHGADS